MTRFATRAGVAGLVALSLAFAAAALPAQAAGLSQNNRKDCWSAQQLKHSFATLLTNISVSRAGERGLYLVTGYARHLEESVAPDLSQARSKSDKVRYVLLFDACTKEVVQQIAPPREASVE